MKSSQFSQESLGAFSSSGLTSDGRLKPDVAAPGSYITSSASQLGFIQHCTIKAMEGTSMAAPAVAGYAAKIRQYFVNGYYPSGVVNLKDGFIPSGSLLKAMLVHSGQPLQFVVDTVNRQINPVPLNTYPSSSQGYGRIQMSKVLNFGQSSLNPLSLFVIGAKDSSQPNFASIKSKTQIDVYTFSTSANPITKVRLTLAYTDYPGLPGASTAMMNILTVYIQNTQTLQKFTPLTVSGAILSNLQVIDIPLANLVPSANYQVFVSVYNNKLVVAQPYALVLTGDIQYLQKSVTDDDSAQYDYTQPQFSNFAIIFIAVTATIIFALTILLLYFRRLTAKSILIDPKSFDGSGYGSPISYLTSQKNSSKRSGLLASVR